ncbi:unnamed protein product [Gongylonema pulchrum]|uniref:ADAM_CR_2 domain-containing protein n=1 Tax=Gongylonema pulchrum TaxID=637853 RepID=A0A183D2W7_9BILA|nr:unnamed protein product [Gongylonema pulchrum]
MYAMDEASTSRIFDFMLVRECTWTDWTECTERCGGGYRQRRQRCFPDKHCDSSPCATDENALQFDACNNMPCNEVRRYSAWGHWLSLNENTEIRYRASCGVEIPDPTSIRYLVEPCAIPACDFGKHYHFCH